MTGNRLKLSIIATKNFKQLIYKMFVITLLKNTVSLSSTQPPPHIFDKIENKARWVLFSFFLMLIFG